MTYGYGGKQVREWDEEHLYEEENYPNGIKIHPDNVSKAKKDNQSKIYVVTTNGDCEGRSTKTIGYFKAKTLEQIAEYIETNDIDYIYDYTIEELEFIDVSQLSPAYIKKVNKGKFGAVETELTSKGKSELSRLKAKNKALAKLSPEERRALGF